MIAFCDECTGCPRCGDCCCDTGNHDNDEVPKETDR